MYLISSPVQKELTQYDMSMQPISSLMWKKLTQYVTTCMQEEFYHFSLYQCTWSVYSLSIIAKMWVVNVCVFSFRNRTKIGIKIVQGLT